MKIYFYKGYDEKLIHCEESKEKCRRIINQRKADRKAQCNIQWFLKRLRWRYFLLYITNRINAKLYKYNVLDKL